MVKVDITASTGSYVGNGTEQSINCGTRPSAVRIIRQDRKYLMEHFDGEITTLGMMALGASDNYRKCEATNGEGITITDTGFDVGISAMINEDGHTYRWEGVF